MTSEGKMNDPETSMDSAELRALAARARLFVIGVSTRVSIDGEYEAAVQLVDLADLSVLEIPTDVATAQALGNFFAQGRENGNADPDSATNQEEPKTIVRTADRPSSAAPVFRQA
jgi:hypothetical protein